MTGDDLSLLHEFVAQRSEPAFAELVRRHIGLVHSAALRQAGGDAHLAEEITQATFIILARKAGSLGRRTILSAWLYRTARYVAADALKTALRRRWREHEAYMQATLNQPDPSNPGETEGAAWLQLAPVLDEAMAQLDESDRTALVLRYFENKSARDIAAALQLEEATAQKRAVRALEKLRVIFIKRGVTLATAALAGAVTANSVQAVPVGLAAKMSAVAAKSLPATSSTAALVKGALKLMAWSKAKTAAVAAAGILLATGTVTLVTHEMTKPKFNRADFWATSYPATSPEAAQFMTNSYGHPMTYTFPISSVQRCSISGLLDQCMEVSGWQYLIDKDVSAGSVGFGCSKVMNGEEWVAAFENALQTGAPEWWDFHAAKPHMRRENLMLIRYPREKIVLVLPKDKAAKYQ
jgi:RNA polymerase sigma factor (sigma-70 family)